MAAKVRGRVSPLSKIQKVKEARARRVGVYFAPGVAPPAEEENWYNAQLQTYVDELHDAIAQTLFPTLRLDSTQIVNVDSKWFKNRDGFIDDLMRGIDKLRKNWEVSNVAARALATNFVGKVDKKTQANIEKIVSKAMGVDVVKILRNEGISDVVDAGIAANVQLIQSIPSEYLNKVQMIITQEGTKGRTGQSLIKQIQEVYPVTQKRARFIARDQTAKLNGDISRQRQVAAGIRGYRWRTVGDNAVRETHKERNGKCYAWAPEFVGQKLEDGTVLLDPEKDDIGNPGDDYNCRCVAEPIIELDRIIQ